MNDLVPKKPDETFFELDDSGNVQEVSMLTGKIIRKAQTVEDLLAGKKLIPSTAKVKIWVYSKAYGEIICQKVVEGLTFSAICSLPGFPTVATLARWRVENSDFDDAVKESRKMRAEMYHDQIAKDINSDEEASKEDIAARKLKMDRLKWLASVNDPETFGTRTKISGDSSAPLRLVVSTGINREEDNGTDS